MASQSSFRAIRLAGKPIDTLWDIDCRSGYIESIREHHGSQKVGCDGRLLIPSLCHPHIHLDKCFLLCHPKYKDLDIQNGNFAEALKITKSLGQFIAYLSDPSTSILCTSAHPVSGQAKSRFELDDLLDRGRELIKESISFGVTHIRAFVEVDKVVGMKCLTAGLALKKEFNNICQIQICVFAQDPIYSQEDYGKEMIKLMEEAAGQGGVDVVGSAPYVETSQKNEESNIKYMVDLASKLDLHLDFHLDYNLDSGKQPSTENVIDELRGAKWKSLKVVTLGHCSRLTLYSANNWWNLYRRIGELPIFFVGLPTSDIFMMGRPDQQAGGGERNRGTLQVPQMINKYGLQCALGVNNVGNAFTPQGSCDPLSVASLGVGIYQAGSKSDVETLLECVSTRAKRAIGLGSETGLTLREGDVADFVAVGAADDSHPTSFRKRRTVAELIYDPCQERTTVFRGVIVSQRR